MLTGLIVSDDQFELKLTFDGISSGAVRSSHHSVLDPRVHYGLQFEESEKAVRDATEGRRGRRCRERREGLAWRVRAEKKTRAPRKKAYDKSVLPRD